MSPFFTKNAKLKNIFMVAINCQPDHLHCLISLGKSQSINEIVKLIKGESSRWINKEMLINKRFAWQREYFAISVSEPHVEKVKNYIWNQEVHHRMKSFQQEHDAFMNVVEKHLG